MHKVKTKVKYFFLFIICIFLIIMAVITWDSLPKNQDSNETVEEAIARLITAHLADADAHIEAGESLYVHKQSATIDHLADSIVEDKVVDGAIILQKLTADKRIIISSFESMDGWYTTGTISQDLSCVSIATTAVLNNIAEIDCGPSFWVGIDWDKDFFYQSTVRLKQITDQLVYFGLGGSDDLGGFSGAGFKIQDGTLYCYHATDSGSGFVYTTFEITDITLTDWNVYRIIYDQSAGELKFYINGTLKKTFDSSLPTDDNDGLFLYEIKTEASAIKKIYISDVLFSTPK